MAPWTILRMILARPFALLSGLLSFWAQWIWGLQLIERTGVFQLPDGRYVVAVRTASSELEVFQFHETLDEAAASARFHLNTAIEHYRERVS